MNNDIKSYIPTCPHCNSMLNSWFIGNCRGRYFNKKLNTFRVKYFCTEKCYNDYKSNYIVEIYNNQPIYCIEIDGIKRYMPYFEANYCFTSIDDCKKRMDAKHISVMNLGMFGIFN